MLRIGINGSFDHRYWSSWIQESIHLLLSVSDLILTALMDFLAAWLHHVDLPVYRMGNPSSHWPRIAKVQLFFEIVINCCHLLKRVICPSLPLSVGWNFNASAKSNGQSGLLVPSPSVSVPYLLLLRSLKSVLIIMISHPMFPNQFTLIFLWH